MPSQGPEVVPAEQVNIATEPVSDTQVQSTEPSNLTPMSPPLISEVRDSEPTDHVVDLEHTGLVFEQPEDITYEDNTTDGETGQYVLPLRSTRGVPTKRYSPKRIVRKSRYLVANIAGGSLSKMAKAFEAALYEDGEIPKTVEQALKFRHLREAMKVEMDTLTRNSTWEKCKLPDGKKHVGCRWVFTIMPRPDGSIERYKVRLIAKGY